MSKTMNPIEVQMAITRVGASAASGISMSLKSPKDLDEDDVTQLMRLLGTVPTVLFIPDKSPADAPVHKIDKEMNQKSRAQMQRNTLYVWWQQQGEKGNFETFYNNKMDAIREQIKEKLL